MASVTQFVKKSAGIADWLLEFIFAYGRRLFRVNIPKQFKWMKNVYYTKSKQWIDPSYHPFFQGLIEVGVVILGILLAIVLFVGCLFRSLGK